MTLITAPCTFPNSAEAPTDCTCTPWIMSTPGSERATPLQGQVVLVPSIRNWFSLTPDPNAEIVVLVPLDGDVAEMPGALRIQSNMLVRRVGIARTSSGPKVVPNPGLRASMRDAPPSTVTDSATPAASSTIAR